MKAVVIETYTAPPTEPPTPHLLWEHKTYYMTMPVETSKATNKANCTYSKFLLLGMFFVGNREPCLLIVKGVSVSFF